MAGMEVARRVVAAVADVGGDVASSVVAVDHGSDAFARLATVRAALDGAASHAAAIKAHKPWRALPVHTSGSLAAADASLGQLAVAERAISAGSDSWTGLQRDISMARRLVLDAQSLNRQAVAIANHAPVPSAASVNATARQAVARINIARNDVDERLQALRHEAAAADIDSILAGVIDQLDKRIVAAARHDTAVANRVAELVQRGALRA